MEVSDKLLEKINQWNDSALNILYSYYYKVLVAYTFRFVEDQQEAEDIVQDTFLNIWNKKPTFNNLSHLKTFLYSSTHNNAIDHLRKMKRTESIEKLRNISDEGLNYHTEDIYRSLFNAIEQLPPKQREIFLLVIEGKKNSEIANALNIAINTVKAQRLKGMRNLRKILTNKQILLLLFISI